MLKFIMRRLLALPAILLFVTFILFALMWQLPVEQRAMIYMPSVRPNATEEEVERLMAQIIARRGLDQPAHIQYLSWLRNLGRGEWGYSPMWRQDVLRGLLSRALATLELVLAAMIPAVGLALLLGPLAARYQFRRAWLSSSLPRDGICLATACGTRWTHARGGSGAVKARGRHGVPGTPPPARASARPPSAP